MYSNEPCNVCLHVCQCLRCVAFSATFFPFHALCVDGTDLSFLSYFGFSGAKAGQSLCGSGPMCFYEKKKITASQVVVTERAAVYLQRV